MASVPRVEVPAKPAPIAAPWTLIGGAGVVFLALALFGLAAVVSVLAVVIQLVFIAYFLRHLAFAMAAFRSAPSDLSAPLLATTFMPSVSVLVACRNELAVIHQLVDGLVALEYPPHLRQIVIVDDASTDGMAAELDRMAMEEPITVIHRPAGSGGGKPGALNDGLAFATGDVVIVFDADHRPHADVVRRLVRHFEDPAVGAVQGRCEISNTADSPLTQLIGIDYLAGYLVNEYGRQAMYNLPAYGGANCAVRASTLKAIGGWNTASVTEDTDLTMRVLLSGQRVRFDVSAVDEEEGVTTVGRYWNQRYRWARGHQQVWRDYRLPIWRSPRLSLGQKVESTMFLLAFHLPVISAVGLLLAFTWLGGLAAPPFQVDLFILWMLLFLGPLVELGGGLLLKQADRRWAMSLFYFLPLFFVSIALCTKAWLDGVLARDYAWVKTQRSRDPRSELQKGHNVLPR